MPLDVRGVHPSKLRNHDGHDEQGDRVIEGLDGIVQIKASHKSNEYLAQQ